MAKKLEISNHKPGNVFEVYNTQLIVNILDETGAMTGKAASISLEEMVDNNDTHGLLLWGLFMQMNMMRNSITQAQDMAMSVRSPFDEEDLEKKMGPVFEFVAKRMKSLGVIPEGTDVSRVLQDLTGGEKSGS